MFNQEDFKKDPVLKWIKISYLKRKRDTASVMLFITCKHCIHFQKI